MKAAAIRLSIALEVVASSIAFAQGGTDPMEQLRACSAKEHPERMKCLDELSRHLAPSSPAASDADDWVVSETTSPVDYSPMVTARSAFRTGSASLQLWIRCQRGKTELVATGPAVSRSGADYAISYGINRGQPVQVTGGSPSSGTGAAFPGDVVRFLQSLPGEGDLSVHLSDRAGDAYDGLFSLSKLKTVRDKIADACKWPTALRRQ